MQAFCCVNLPVSPSDPIPSNSNPSAQLALPQNGSKWRRQCVLGVACVVIVSTTGDVSLEVSSAAAAEPPSPRVIRWSDKRACPPWHVNSLQNIVPENLPRPSAHRRWENVRYRQDAPAVKANSPLKPTINTRNDCFTL